MFTIPSDLPANTELIIDVSGASGGGTNGGLGGNVIVSLPVNPSQVFIISIGEQGRAWTATSGCPATVGGGGACSGLYSSSGGGATTVTSSQGNIRIIAGGGGGSGSIAQCSGGGSGGGLEGGQACTGSTSPAATQTTGGVGGIGGSGTAENPNNPSCMGVAQNCNGGGGGGGVFGGAGGRGQGGGGGSGFVGGNNVVTQSNTGGRRLGNGLVVFTITRPYKIISVASPTPNPTLQPSMFPTTNILPPSLVSQGNNICYIIISYM